MPRHGMQFRWAAISITAFVNMVVGGYAGIMSLLEVENIWTTRFYVITIEHYWYCMATFLLAVALGLEIAAFALGENADTGILIIATELGFGLCAFVIESIRQQSYRKILWEAWTGSSRTQRPLSQAHIVAQLEQMKSQLLQSGNQQQRKPTESIFNWAGQCFHQKTKMDIAEAMDLLDINKQTNSKVNQLAEDSNLQIYPLITGKNDVISVKWGGPSSSLFHLRVSRGISMFDQKTIVKAFSLTKASEEKWIMIAAGIVARNKGLCPEKLICKLNEATATGCYAVLENASKWHPRSNKTSRTSYRNKIKELYGVLGDEYVTAVTELAILIPDVPHIYLRQWLEHKCEHQDVGFAWAIWNSTNGSTDVQLSLYKTSYISMLFSLNCGRANPPQRVDATCLLIHAALEAQNNNNSLLATIMTPHSIQCLKNHITKELNAHKSFFNAILAMLGVANVTHDNNLFVKTVKMQLEIFKNQTNIDITV